MPDNQNVRWADGTLDFSLGVDSNRPSTLVSDNNPNGLPRNAYAWGNNVTTRGGGLIQRTGWQPIATLHDSTGLYQGGFMYDQQTNLPYLVYAISGRFYRIRLDTDNSIDDITGPVAFPTTAPLYHFVQGEEFLVVQAGDFTTLPAFWDGTSMRHSLGLAGATKELPAAGTMVYYQGRIWYAQYRQYTAGDIVGGPSGTGGPPYFNRDSILKVTENPLAIGGDGFAVPTQAGNIRAMQYAANLDKALGEGTLYVFTRKQIYALDVPISRTDWIASGSNNQPLQRVVQRNNGAASDRSVVAVNADLFYQSLTPSINSLFTALRYFNQWGNSPISANLDRAMQFNDRSLMSYSSGIEFNNRMLQCILPEQRPQGVVHKAIAPMDFDPISTLGKNLNPVWEGIYEGLDILQLFQGDFGGRERAFAIVVSRVDSSIQLWELTTDQRFENGDNRVEWYVETPAWTWGREFDLKKLDGGEIWIDKIFGTVDGKVYYRVDGNPCWQFWHAFQFCLARTSCEDVNNPVCYPMTGYREGDKFPVTLPTPPTPECYDFNHRPMNIGHQFQVKIEMKGWCRLRGLIVYALPYVKAPFDGLECGPSPFSGLYPNYGPSGTPASGSGGGDTSTTGGAPIPPQGDGGGDPTPPAVTGLIDYQGQNIPDYQGNIIGTY